jgi:outer membrane protein TolC
MVIQRINAAPPLFVALLALASGAAAEPLSLADALAQGRAQARAVAAADARAEAAQARARQAKSYHLPQVRFSESWIRTDAPADVFGLLLSQERFSFQSFVASDPNSPDDLDTAISRVEVELPIWTGGEISTRVEQARLAAEAAGAQAGFAADAAALAAGEAWLQLAQAREYVALLERSRETVAAHVALARDYAAQGMLVRSELLRAEVELARIDDLLAEARGRARLAESALAFRLGAEQGTAYELGEIAAPGDVEGDLAAWLARADRRQDLAAARGQLAAGELEAKAVAAGRWPRVGAAARHDWTDDSLFGTNGSATSIFVGASIDLFDGGRRGAQAAAARAEAEAAKRDVESFAEGVALEIRQAWEAATVGLSRQRTAAQALAAAAEAERIVAERFGAGVVKTLDVLDAATARREAETRELVARADARAAQLRLALAAGERPESMLAAGEPPASSAASLSASGDLSR